MTRADLIKRVERAKTAAAKEICRERCAAYGDPPCWKVSPSDRLCDNIPDMLGPGCMEIVDICERNLRATEKEEG